MVLCLPSLTHHSRILFGRTILFIREMSPTETPRPKTIIVTKQEAEESIGTERSIPYQLSG